MLIVFRWVPPGVIFLVRERACIGLQPIGKAKKQMSHRYSSRILVFGRKEVVYRVVFVFVKAVCFSQYFDCVVALRPQLN